jgi:hypothetical protein
MTELDTRSINRPRSRKKAVWTAVTVVVVIGIALALALFQPWRLFTRSTVDEALPVAAAAVTPTPAGVSDPAGSTAGDSATDGSRGSAGAGVGSAIDPPTPGPITTASPLSVAPAQPPATEPSATAPPAGKPPADKPPATAPAVTEPVVLATGSFVDGEHTTTGTASVLQLPDGSRYVRLEGFSTSDGPDVQVWITDQQAGGDDWGKYDDGRYVELGALKGTDGNQNYAVPADAGLAGLTSVVVWCDRFNVAFGSAAVDL